MDCSPPGSSVHRDSPGENTGVGCYALLQGIFPNQVSPIAGGFFTIWAMREAQEYWSRYPIPCPEALPNSGIELGSSALQVVSLPAELPGKPNLFFTPYQLRTTFTFYLFIYYWPHHAVGCVGLNLRPLTWKGGVVTTGLPGKSWFYIFKLFKIKKRICDRNYMWPTKPEMFIIWPVIGKVCQPLL